jgi:hypothetical protein
MLSGLTRARDLTTRTSIRGVLLALVGALAIAATCGVALVAAAMHSRHSPVRCGSFAVPGAAVEVTIVSGRVGCRAARRVLHEFWQGSGRYHGPAHRRRGYTTVRHWRCPDISPGLSQCALRGSVVEGTYAVGKTASR